MNSTAHQLIEDNLAILRQGRELIDGVDVETYAEARADLGLSGLGPHVRHVTDFYLRFLSAFEGELEPGKTRRIDYDARERDPLTESSPVHAREVLARIMVGLRRLEPGMEACRLEVRGDDSEWIESNLRRELLSLLGHTIHHYALMAVVVRASGGEPPAGFGVAPSTLRHWEEQGAAEASAVSACAR